MASQNRGNPGNASASPRYPGTFMLAFREALASMKWTARRWLGDAVACMDAEGDEHMVGLENLYRRARREDRDKWPALIQDFLSRVRTAETAREEDRDLAAVADKLLLRFGLPFAAMPNQLKVWSRPLEGTNLGINIVIDQADTMVYVTEEMVEKSGRPANEWYERALANLRERTRPDCLEEVHEESGLRLCSVGDAYDSSRALLIDFLLPEPSEMGVLLAIPNRDELLVMPITRDSMANIPMLKLLAAKNFKNAPYAISDELYWVHSGAWRLFPVIIRKQKVDVNAPREFIDLLYKFYPDDLQAFEEESEEQSGEEGTD